jgi:hypothetical protein
MKKDKQKQKLQEGAGAMPAPLPLPTRMRVRMLKSIATAYGAFRIGSVVVIPTDAARSWIENKLAEEDKTFDVPETK